MSKDLNGVSSLSDFKLRGNAKRGKGKSKTTAAILSLLLGGIGVQRFYLGQPGWGLLFFFFAWTFIPAIVAWVDFFRFLFMSDERFDTLYNK